MIARLPFPNVKQRFVFPDIQSAPKPGLRGAAIVASALLAILVDGTATSIINAGLPYLQGVTAASPDEGSWILTTFNATYYAFVLLSPWLMATIGRKLLLVGALTGFTAISLVLAVTSDYTTFVALRALQGACLGSVFVPAVITFFTSLSPAALTYATPVFILTALSGSTIGTVVGAFAADEFGASTVFVPGAIATAITAVLVALAVDGKDTRQRLPFDAIGISLSILAFGSLQYLINEGERRNWFDDAGIVTGAAVFAASTITFVAYELFLAHDPHVDLRMFAKYRNLLVGAIINIAVGATGYSVTMFVGYLQNSIAATATLAGAVVLIRLAAYVVGVFTAFLLIRRKIVDLRAVVIAGAIGSIVGLAGFSNAMTTTADAATFVGLSLFFGFFYSMLSQPIGTLVVGSMPLPLLAAGVSIYKLTSPIGLMIATGAMQTVLDHRTAFVRSNLAASIDPARAVVAQFVASHGTGALTTLVAAQAQTLSYGFAMFVFAFVLMPVMAVVFFVKLPKPA
jgi:DHA2 family multidrug resistance protein